MNLKWHNGILIQSQIFTLKYHPGYVWQDPPDAVQYSVNAKYDAISVLFIIERFDVVSINFLLPNITYI